MEKLHFELKQKHDKFDQRVDGLSRQMVGLCKEALKGPKIRIEIPKHEILAAKSTPQHLIQGKIKANVPHQPYLQTDCFVACGHWHKLEGLKENTINIIDHLDKLIPTNQGNRMMGPKDIGLITFQNGIMNDLNNFKNISNKIIEQFPEAPLCIGLHNPTTGAIGQDMFRFNCETQLNAIAVYSLCQMFKTLADILPKINPNVLWAHFAHSEGGLIANTVFNLCEESWWDLVEARKYIKDHLITATYGAVKPIPDDYVLYSMNTYSKNDIALFFGQNYLDRELDDKLLNQITENNPYDSEKIHQGKKYKIRLIDSKSQHNPVFSNPIPRILTREQRSQMSWGESQLYHQELEDSSWLAHLGMNKVNDFCYSIDDHGFVNDSYQGAFIKNVNYLRDIYKIHNFKRNW